MSNHEPSECGHSDEEHNEMRMKEDTEMIRRILAGDFTGTFAGLDMEALQRNLEGIYMEMYLRAPDDEAYKLWVDSIRTGVYDVLLPDENGESRDPEVLAQAQEMRAKLQAAFKKDSEAEDFMAEAGDELRIMLEQHGVADDIKPEDLPGQYL